MDRALVAYFIIALVLAVAALRVLAASLVLACGVVVVSLTRRFLHYERQQRRGHHDQKPVWKPFWML